MRLFQNSGLYPSYLAYLNRLARDATSFAARLSIFMEDRFGALHVLEPVLEGAPEAFFTNADDEILQRLWAREHGLPVKATLEDILLAQIEQQRTEVFYNSDPIRYPSSFVRRLPGSVRTALCWRAVPSRTADLTAYGAVLGNFPSILESWRRKGCRDLVGERADHHDDRRGRPGAKRQLRRLEAEGPPRADDWRRRCGRR